MSHAPKRPGEDLQEYYYRAAEKIQPPRTLNQMYDEAAAMEDCRSAQGRCPKCASEGYSHLSGCTECAHCPHAEVELSVCVHCGESFPETGEPVG